MLNCIIVDDENKARLLLRNMLSTIQAEINILEECKNLPECIKAISIHKPDVVFLDIEMPGQSGIEILNYIPESDVNFEIVFTTGFSEYALQAFKLSAADYLLKPINPLELKATVEKLTAKKNKFEKTAYQALYQNLSSSSDASNKCITVFTNNATRFVKLNDLVMLKAEGAYTELHTVHGDKLLASKNLKYFEERLLEFDNFLRSQKSFIINIDMVVEFQKTENTIKLKNNLLAQISNDKHDLFLSKMGAC
jgi:two-component system, LytTR family, response regulator